MNDFPVKLGIIQFASRNWIRYCRRLIIKIVEPILITSKTASTTNSKKIAFAALHHKDFRAYFFATMLAMMADNIEHVISYWLLYEKFKSPGLAAFPAVSPW